MSTAPRIARWRRENPTRHRQTVTRYRLSVKGTAAHLWKGAKARAESKGLPFDLTKEWIAEKLLQGKCAVTQIPFVREKSGAIHPFSPSIDRIIPVLGYTKSNCRVTVFALNAARGHWGDDVLKQVCEAFMKHITK